ncbi:hypothetical protein [Maribacter sp. ACAM166]|nr:hypothetical protein [Maribacter sp. ACAM166]
MHKLITTIEAPSEDMSSLEIQEVADDTNRVSSEGQSINFIGQPL